MEADQIVKGSDPFYTPEAPELALRYRALAIEGPYLDLPLRNLGA